MKEILKYIQLYTGCNDHALKRIEVMLEPRLQPKIIEKIVEVEKYIQRRIKPKTPISVWAEVYFTKNLLSYNEVSNKSRKRHVVDIRHEFIKIAYQNGYTCTSIASYLKKDHSTILHAISK
jgi:chromosomal replication initiation ATPase DnaA